jgi:hypothetical protein
MRRDLTSAVAHASTTTVGEIQLISVVAKERSRETEMSAWFLHVEVSRDLKKRCATGRPIGSNPSSYN